MDGDEHDPDDRPWERPGAVRRDAEPHRGQLLVGLGTAVWFLGVVSACLLPLAVVALSLGVAVLVMVRRDREAVKAGVMEPGDEQALSRGTERAWLGVALAAAALAPLTLLALSAVPGLTGQDAWAALAFFAWVTLGIWALVVFGWGILHLGESGR